MQLVHQFPLVTALIVSVVHLFPFVLTLELAPDDSVPRRFNADCSDPHYKEIACVVTAVDCSVTNDELVPHEIARSGPYPREAHDIRVETFSKATSRRRAGDGYQLSVEVSWQTPPDNSSKLLHGFLLEVEGENGRMHSCFLLNTTSSNWTGEATSEAPRLHFSTDTLFHFSSDYEINVYSLPESPGSSNFVQKRFSAPHNPSHGDDQAVQDNATRPISCTRRSNPFASKWTAGFKKIVLHSLARIIQVHFVGAPPQYCFEQYELRLLDESGMELLHSGLVAVEDMRPEVVGNSTTVYYGSFNFTNLELDVSYIPSVIPAERARDGRCLCPVHGTDPYDNNVVCSCVAAEWKPVRLSRPDIVQRDDLIDAATAASPPSSPNDQGIPSWLPYALLNIGILLVLLAVGLILLFLHQQYRKSAKISNIRFVTRSGKRGAEMPPASGGYSTLLENGHLLTSPDSVNHSVDQPQQPLSVLIVYSHDSKLHDETVLALAELLRDVFHMEVALDVWDRPSIEANLVDYLSSAVINADKVLVVNSIGAYQRYLSKIKPPELNSATAAVDGTTEWIVEKKESAGLLDRLFVPQLDMALQHHSVISTRFSNTQAHDLLPMLQGHLQYTLPEHLVPLLSRLTHMSMKADGRVRKLESCPQAKSMRKRVEQMVALERNAPNWFFDTHHRRLVPCGVGKGAAKCITNGPTLIRREMGSNEVIPLVITVEEGESGIDDGSGLTDSKLSPSSSVNIGLEAVASGDSGDIGGVEAEAEEEFGVIIMKEPQFVECLLPADSGVFHTLDTSTAQPTPLLAKLEAERIEEVKALKKMEELNDTEDSGLVPDLLSDSELLVSERREVCTMSKPPLLSRLIQ